MRIVSSKHINTVNSNKPCPSNPSNNHTQTKQSHVKNTNIRNEIFKSPSKKNTFSVLPPKYYKPVSGTLFLRTRRNNPFYRVLGTCLMCIGFFPLNFVFVRISFPVRNIILISGKNPIAWQIFLTRFC